MVSDPYSLLGIGKDASKEEIKKAYRKKAKEYHPDLHPNDPKAAEKMNEINEAYDMLCNPEKYQRQEQSNNGYRGYQGQSTYGQNTYRGYGNNQSNGGYGGFGGFDFEDLFGFGQRYQEIPKPTRNPNDSSEIKEAVDFIYSGNYEYANRVLNQVVSMNRDARWHYLSALANHGLGNRIRALEEIQKAMQMEPANQTYSQVYDSMRQSGNAYTSNQNYQQYADGMQQYCRNFMMLQCFCMFCRCC